MHGFRNLLQKSSWTAPGFLSQMMRTYLVTVMATKNKMACRISVFLIITFQSKSRPKLFYVTNLQFSSKLKCSSCIKSG